MAVLRTLDNLPAIPLPLFAMVPIGALTTRDGEELTVYMGASEEVVGALKKRSLDTSDTDIQDHTSDRVRFGEGSYEDWYNKGRTPFSLLNDAGELAAFAWFGPKPLGRKSLKHLSKEERAAESSQHEEVWHTVSYRAYPPYRGKGIMTPFIRFAIDIYREATNGAQLWAGINPHNPASVGLIQKLGFVKDEDTSDDSHAVFILPN